ncbi:MAG: NUDIX hydrolase [Anaerolineales bacterium]|nr:MAG: NUDIX hydrolase [Anaerolineales bacterium]
MTHATVAAIITKVQDDGVKVLLTQRNVEPFKGKWSLPGGHIDRYETARDAAVREVKEETGLAFGARFFRYFDEILPTYGIHAVVIVFAGPAKGELRPEETEVSALGWFCIDQVRSMPLAFAHNEILDAYVSAEGKENCL